MLSKCFQGFYSSTFFKEKDGLNGRITSKTKIISKIFGLFTNQNQNEAHFYSQWLSSLFFGAFNKKTHLINSELPDEIKESFSLMPFLIKWRFIRKNELDELNFDLLDNIFEWLFEPDEQGNNKQKDFLKFFNFTT